MNQVLPDIEIVNIDDIHPNPDNPRIIHDDKFLKLVESIENFPKMLYIRPIVVDVHSMIIGGNQRYEACKELKYTEVPIIRAIDLTDEQYKQFIIRDNLNSGNWDIDKLIEEWDADILEACNFDMTIINTALPEGADYSEKNQEIDYNEIEDKQVLKITLTESNYNEAVEYLRGISEDISAAFMELITNAKKL